MIGRGRLPDPRARWPLTFPNGERHLGTVFLANAIDHPNIEAGDYTYANDNAADASWDWAGRLAPYTFPGSPERLRIGRFRQIAQAAQFVTASANHPMAGASTYPFGVFDPDRIGTYLGEVATGGDLMVGHDCWIGAGATLLPTARLGDGVIVGARAVVAGSVPDYAIVAGNPARIVRMRFDATTVARLTALAWWTWPHSEIEDAIALIEAADVDALEAAAPPASLRAEK